MQAIPGGENEELVHNEILDSAVPPGPAAVHGGCAFTLKPQTNNIKQKKRIN